MLLIEKESDFSRLKNSKKKKQTFEATSKKHATRQVGVMTLFFYFGNRIRSIKR